TGTCRLFPSRRSSDLSSVEQHPEVFRPKLAPLAFGKTAQRKPADLRTVQREHAVADRGEHPPHLVVAAFVQDHARAARSQHLHRDRKSTRLNSSHVK